MRGGPVPGSVKLTRGATDLALDVSVGNVSQMIEIGRLVRSATTESWKYVPNSNTEDSEQSQEARYNVENPQRWEKPRQPTGCKIHYMREVYNNTKKRRGNNLLSSSSPRAAAVT